MDGDDDRFGRILNGGEEGMKAGTASLTGCDGFREFVDIRARDKGAAAAEDDDRLDFGIGLGGFERGLKAFGHARTEGVHGRIVDDDDGDRAVLRESDEWSHFNFWRRRALTSSEEGRSAESL